MFYNIQKLSLCLNLFSKTDISTTAWTNARGPYALHVQALLEEFFIGIESLNLSLIKMKKYYSRQPVLFFFFWVGEGWFIKEKRVVFYILPIDLEMPINGGRWIFEEFY